MPVNNRIVANMQLFIYLFPKEILNRESFKILSKINFPNRKIKLNASVTYKYKTYKPNLRKHNFLNQKIDFGENQ